MIKKYFFCLFILNIIHCHAMRPTGNFTCEKNPNDIHVESIRKTIDHDFLGIDENSYFRRPIIGSCLSVYHGKHLSLENAQHRIEQIKGYVSDATKETNKAQELQKQQEYILQQLNDQHWYVHYIIQTLVANHVKHFQKTGKKTYYIPQFNANIDGIVEKMIYKKALDRHLLKI